MKLVLVRHGESNWNRTGLVQGWRDPHLSTHGENQTKLLARKLSANHFKAIYSSPLRRAYQSAKILAAALGVSIKTCEGLKEMHLGKWEGKPLKRIEQEYPGMPSRWFERPTGVKIPGGESIASFRKRVITTLDEIRERHHDENIIVVAHGGVISIYLVHLLGMDPDRIWRIPLKNAAITTLIFDQDRVNVANFNDTCHLNEELTFQKAW